MVNCRIVGAHGIVSLIVGKQCSGAGTEDPAVYTRKLPNLAQIIFATARARKDETRGLFPTAFRNDCFLAEIYNKREILSRKPAK